MNIYLYRQIDIWKRIDDNSAIRFRCFENLSTKQYCVQSSDFFYFPIDEKQLIEFDKQFLELFIEDHPDDRSSTFLTIEEAISFHLKEFDGN